MTTRIPLDAIVVGSGRRKTDKAKMKALAESITTIGLRTPITVLSADTDGKYKLVVGRNRLDAHRLLGRLDIEATIEADTLSAALWEIAENLHRADLTAMQRNVLLGKWVKLKARKIKQDQRDKVAQLGPPAGGVQPSDEGIRAAARELSIPRSTAQRAVYIAENLTKAAQREAEELGLANNQRVLHRAAGRLGPAEQIASLRQSLRRAQERKRQRTQMQSAIASMKTPRTVKEVFRDWLDSLDIEFRMQVRIWLLSEEAETYLEELGQAEEQRRAGRLH